MTRILCAKSGIEFKVEHFSLFLSSRELSHPIFSVSYKELQRLSTEWLDGQLTNTETYLLYVALLDSTGLVDFRVPTEECNQTHSVIAKNMSELCSITEIINNLGEYKLASTEFPRISITPDTKHLLNSRYWIQIWQQAYAEYCTGYKSYNALQKLAQKESQLERLIKDKTKDLSTYIIKLADWTALAGNFAEHADYIVLDENDKPIVMGDYWKRIIRACVNPKNTFYIPEVDLIDLIEHCEETIEHGSIFAHLLMSILRAALNYKTSYINTGDVEINTSGNIYRILDADSSVEDANKLALIESAPVEKPTERQYPNKLAFLKAKMKYELAESYRISEELRKQKDNG